MKSWTVHEDYILSDLLFETNRSYSEIALELGRSEVEVKTQIKALGLDWVKKSRKRTVSRGQSALTDIFQKLLPGESIINEKTIGKLRLDVYCPRFKLAAEYHGQQHYQYNEFFHGSRKGYQLAVDRDDEKITLCKEQGISLVIFRYTDGLTEELVYDRLMDAIRATPVIKEEPEQFTYYEAAKHRQREWRRKQYREMKRRKSGS